MDPNTIWHEEALRLYPKAESSDLETGAMLRRQAFVAGVLFATSQMAIGRLNAPETSSVEAASPDVRSDPYPGARNSWKSVIGGFVSRNGRFTISRDQDPEKVSVVRWFVRDTQDDFCPRPLATLAAAKHWADMRR